MRRVLAVLTSTAIFVSLGCGSKSYDRRLNETIRQIKYKKKLDDNLMPASTKGKLEQNVIYLRPPKNLEKMSEFSLLILEPGKFDIAETFVEKDVQKLHVLAWLPKVKDPKKKATGTPEAARGQFKDEVIAILNNVFGVEIDGSKAKTETKGKNQYKHLTFEANGMMVQTYIYGEKGRPPEVALIFEYPKAENLLSKIDLCLESFATGPRARLLFSGSDAEEGGEAAPTSGGPM
jgi:hypothetical protein